MGFYICENRIETPLKATPRCEKEDLPALVIFILLVARLITQRLGFLVLAYYFSEQRGTRGGRNSIYLNRKWPGFLETRCFSRQLC